MIRKAIGVAGPAILLAPIAAPILHGLSGIAVVGIGLFATGTVVAKTVSALSAKPKPRNNPEEEQPFDEPY